MEVVVVAVERRRVAVPSSLRCLVVFLSGALMGGGRHRPQRALARWPLL